MSIKFDEGFVSDVIVTASENGSVFGFRAGLKVNEETGKETVVRAKFKLLRGASAEEMITELVRLAADQQKKDVVIALSVPKMEDREIEVQLSPRYKPIALLRLLLQRKVSHVVAWAKTEEGERLLAEAPSKLAELSAKLAEGKPRKAANKPVA